jgi:hypothetical protein
MTTTTTTTTTAAERVAAFLRAADLMPPLYVCTVYRMDEEVVAVFAMDSPWGPTVRAITAMALADEFGADNVSHSKISAGLCVLVEGA